MALPAERIDSGEADAGALGVGALRAQVWPTGGWHALAALRVSMPFIRRAICRLTSATLKPQRFGGDGIESTSGASGGRPAPAK